VHTSLYLPEPIYETLRLAAFKERKKINDIVVEGIELAPRMEALSAKPKAKVCCR
jgi:hypothetical protein